MSDIETSSFLERMKSDKRLRNLVDAYLDGLEIEARNVLGLWVVVKMPNFCLPSDHYRVVVVRDEIPIEAIDDRWKFYARDDGDETYLYTLHPEFDSDLGEWGFGGGFSTVADALKITISSCLPEESLIDLDELRREKGLLK